MKKAPVKWIVLSLIIIAILISGYFLHSANSSARDTKSQPDSAAVIPSDQKKDDDGETASSSQQDSLGNNSSINASKTQLNVYENTQYGFNFSLPDTWNGYTIINDKWKGMAQGASQEIETGPLISIRHPLWTEKNPRQDIPIMIFTLSQWNSLLQDKFHIGAAPISPSELARNSKYVFALPARYNYAFPTGFEEVETIINNKSLKPTEAFK